MFTKLSTSQRLQVGFVLAMAFLLVLGSNRLNQRHFYTIQTTVNSVFKDRVVVQDLIYQLNTIFHTKELRFVLNDNFKTVGTENLKIEELLTDFRTTDLTSKEFDFLEKLNEQFIHLKELESASLESSGLFSENTRAAAVKKLGGIKRSLNGLAEIQLEESGKLTQVSNKSLSMNILLSKLEVGFLIVIGIAMLALIFHPIEKIRVFN